MVYPKRCPPPVLFTAESKHPRILGSSEEVTGALMAPAVCVIARPEPVEGRSNLALANGNPEEEPAFEIASSP
jgi:hypothetical protein